MLDLTTWNLSIPTDPTPTTISTERLNNAYESRHFRRNADGSVTFWVPVTGSRTADARYPRSELRERIDTFAPQTRREQMREPRGQKQQKRQCF